MRALLLVPLAAIVAVVAIERPRSREAAAPPLAGDSLPSHFGLGRAATAAELARVDIDVRADGRGLPAGSGTAAGGAKIFAARCVACHGKNGEGVKQGTLQVGPALIGRNPGDAFDFNQSTQKEGAKTIGNYWPYATTLFDYVRRAMPYDHPGSLTNDEVYALTAYLLERNQIVQPGAVIDAKSLPTVAMPSRGRFVRDDRETSTKVR